MQLKNINMLKLHMSYVINKSHARSPLGPDPVPDPGWKKMANKKRKW
jgi:hypothetical protein